MALVLQDRVSVTSAGSGTGDLALGSAYPGYRTFASCIPDGSIVYYTIANQALGYENEWEVGYGTYVLGTDTLQRNTGNPATSGIYSSSNANAYVNFTAGTNGLQIFITYPSEQAVYQQPSGITEFNEGPISVVGANATPSSFAATLAQFFSNEPGYSQLYIQNQSNDANASADIVAYNDIGDGTSYFIDMGMSSSNYNDGDYPIFQENDAYLFNAGNVAGTGAAGDISRLMIGTSTANSNVVIFGGSVNTGAEIATFVASTKDVNFANNVTVTETLNANSVTVTTLAYAAGNIANAANNTVLVTQAYVDAAVSNGFHVHQPVKLSTASPLSGTPSYNQPGGAGNGVGATLTASGAGFLDVDGQNADAGFRILVQSESNAVWNGIYTVTTEGDGSTAYQLTRATDADTYVPQSDTGLGGGDYFFVESGDTQAYFSFICTNDGTITFGTTPITFQNFSQVPVYTGTSPINVSGQTISLTGVVNEAHGGTNLSSYTTGDIIYANASNTLANLAIGSQYSVLSVSGAGVPHWSTVALGSANAVSGTLGATSGGTGQSTYTTGDLLYASAANTLSKLPGQTTTTQKFLSQTGDGSNSAAPSWVQISGGDISGLGTMSTQNANSVTITGGSLDNVVIGGNTANAGTFTNVNATTVTATTGSFTNVSGNGATLTNINASNISSGTIGNTYTTGNTANSASTLVLRDSNGAFSAGAITGAFIIGDGSNLTAINASNISSGTIANARTTAASANGASTIVSRDSGGNFSANTITANVAGSGSGLTNINASNISSGTIGNVYTTANTANSAATIVLRDAGGAFAAGQITASSFVGNGSAITAINASSITTGTIDNARTTASSANGASTIVARDAGGNFSANTITATTFSGAHSGNGAALTNINASNISSGTIGNAYTTANTSNVANTIVLRGASGEFSAGAITAASISGNGVALTAINASNVTSGTLDNARTTASSSNGASTIVARDATGSFTANTINATTFSGAHSGNGAALTNINASNITSGTISNAYTTANSANGANTIVSRDANGSFSANIVNATFTGNASSITDINASNITSGTISNARTTANSSNSASTIVLRDSNGSFSSNVISASFFSGDGSNLTSINAASITTGTLGASRLSGSYTGITGVGTLTIGTWNANVVSAQYGGTGSANLTANNVILGNGANTVQVVAPGTSNNVLTSNGTTWISRAPTGGGISADDAYFLSFMMG